MEAAVVPVTIGHISPDAVADQELLFEAGGPAVMAFSAVDGIISRSTKQLQVLLEKPTTAQIDAEVLRAGSLVGTVLTIVDVEVNAVMNTKPTNNESLIDQLNLDHLSPAEQEVVQDMLKQCSTVMSIRRH
jgi:hypothetical protein